MGSERMEILLAACNGEAYLRAQIDSILSQQDPRWHLTVSDDGSRDGTVRILDGYARRFPERISRVEAGRTFGCARDHFFFLMQQCDADYIMFSDQDDVFYPQKVGTMLEAMLAAERSAGKETPVLVFSDQRPTDAQLRPLAPSLMRYQRQSTTDFDYRSLLMQNTVTGGAMAINRALAGMGGRCADPSGVVMHDGWLAAVAARFGRIVYIDEPLSDYRQHAGNSVGAKHVGSAAYVLHELSQLGMLQKKIRCKKRQAQVFLQTYAAQLNEEDAAFLSGFAQERSGPLFYMKNREHLHGFMRRAGMMLLG